MPAPTLKTHRLTLRQWTDADLEPFAMLNADSIVMECFPGTLSQQESDQLAKRIRKELEEEDFGLWAAEVNRKFIGFVGLHKQSFIKPEIEIGWRLAKEFWGNGYATEAASKVLEYAFHILKIEAISSFTVPKNVRSRNVMEKLGMTYAGNFEHPKLPEGHPLKTHVYYVIEKTQYLSAHPQQM